MSATKAQLAAAEKCDARCAANIADYWAKHLGVDVTDAPTRLRNGLPPGVDGVDVPCEFTGPFRTLEPKPKPNPAPRVHPGRTGTPVTVEGELYPSMSAACRAWNISIETVKRRKACGWEGDYIFTTPSSYSNNRKRKQLGGTPEPVTVQGHTFASIHQAAKFHGVSAETSRARLKHGTPPDVAFVLPPGEYRAWRRKHAP